jgi:hypothetical protein
VFLHLLVFIYLFIYLFIYFVNSFIYLFSSTSVHSVIYYDARWGDWKGTRACLIHQRLLERKRASKQKRHHGVIPQICDVRHLSPELSRHVSVSLVLLRFLLAGDMYNPLFGISLAIASSINVRHGTTRPSAWKQRRMSSNGVQH